MYESYYYMFSLRVTYMYMKRYLIYLSISNTYILQKQRFEHSIADLQVEMFKSLFLEYMLKKTYR